MYDIYDKIRVSINIRSTATDYNKIIAHVDVEQSIFYLCLHKTPLQRLTLIHNISKQSYIFL